MFFAQLWKARLQASVEKPESLVIAAMQRLEEISVSLRTEKSGFFKLDENKSIFPVLLFFFYQVAPLAPFILLLLDCVLPLLSNYYSTWLFPGWILPANHLENLRLYLEQYSLSPDASELGS